MQLTKKDIASFQKFIWNFYAANGRQFAWRNTHDPYAITVSEIMLQQTQTHRVAQKYELWLAEFPDFESLAQAPLRDVLSVWQGLGYNRRAMALQKIAQRVMTEFNGVLPADPEVLVTFPGIGKNTAGSICAFAFNMPTVFIETNIRAVYIHTFFKDKTEISDKELQPLIAQTVDSKAREWYYALMDYGVLLKQQHANPSRKSKHHATQSKFEGSDRQVRGMVLRYLTAQSMNMEQLVEATKKESMRVAKIVEQLCNEGFVRKNNDEYMIS
ncbi:MAG: A/G-specific adenine glycosylase [Candidatus Dependentiae bacterium]|nr:A/G-specific adenine glycosylase [Candidatus Dependentiae bacterium]